MPSSFLKTYSDSVTLKKLVSYENCQLGGGGFENAVVTYEKFGSAVDVMYMCEYQAPHKLKSPDDVTIKIEASSVCFTDCLIRRNSWCKQVPLPNKAGSDCIGRVYGVGRTAFKNGVRPGDRVAALSRFLGGNAKYATVLVEDLIPVPDDMDASAVICILRNYVAAYHNLYRTAEYPMERRDSVLIIGADEGMGEAAVQLALLGGARVYAVASAKQHKYLKSIGVKALGPREHEWLPHVEGRMDLVIDYIGENGYDSAHAALNEDGQLVRVGLKEYLLKRVSLFGVDFSSLCSTFKAYVSLPRSYSYDIFEFFDENKDVFLRDLHRLFKLCKTGKIKPNINKIISLSQIASLHEQIEKGHTKGTVLCNPTLEFSTAPSGQQEYWEDEMRGDASTQVAGDTCFCDGGPLLISPSTESEQTRSRARRENIPRHNSETKSQNYAMRKKNYDMMPRNYPKHTSRSPESGPYPERITSRSKSFSPYSEVGPKFHSETRPKRYMDNVQEEISWDDGTIETNLS